MLKTLAGTSGDPWGYLGTPLEAFAQLPSGGLLIGPEHHEINEKAPGAQKSPKTTPRDPPGDSTPEAHEPAK